MTLGVEASGTARLDAASSAATRTGAEALVRGLESMGIEVMFGLCGHTNVAMLDALAGSKIRFIGVRHEQVAAHAADGYFRVTHRPAAVLTTIGPGLTNALTAIGDAALDCSAMLVICGDVPTYLTGRDAFQELNLHGDAQQIDVCRPLVKRAWRVPHRSMLVDLLVRAANHAVTGRPGPVLLDVPLDLFSEPGHEVIPDISSRRPTTAQIPAPASEIERIVDLLTSAERPVIYAGGGAVLAEANVELTALAEHLGIPVVTSLSGQGAISQDHPLSGGYTATVGTPVGHELVNTADVLLVLGSQLGEMETSSYRPDVAFCVPPTRLVQVDIDATQIGKNYPVEVGIVADIRTVVAQLLDAARASHPQRDWQATPRIQALLEKKEIWSSEIGEAASSDATPIVVERLLADIRRALPPEGIFLTDVGIRHQVAQQFPVYAPMTHYVGSGWGTMGGAVAAALGAKLGRPDVPVVAEVGDGAFGSVLSAVVTAVEHGIAATWVVMNNYGYSSINVYQAKHGLSSLGGAFRSPDGKPYNPDFAAFAEACGARGRTIVDAGALLPALEEAIASNEPWVLDVRTEEAPRTRASGYWDVNDVLSGARFGQTDLSE